MKTIWRRVKWSILLLPGMLLWSGQATAVTPAPQPVITSLSVVGNYLIFNATIPAAAVQTILEMRPTLNTAWQESALLDVPAGGGSVEFTIPKPALETAFFRLRTTTSATTEAQLSAELQYVTMPSLGRTDPDALPGTDAVFHFKGIVDGSDRILGATIVARHAGEMISELTLAMVAGVGMRTLSRVIHASPAQAGAIKAAADAYCRTQVTPTIKARLLRWLAR